MTKYWGEFVHITAHRFRRGTRPWTAQEFYLHSVIQDEAAHTTDPICIEIFESEGIRVAESDEWWIDDRDVWSCYPLPLDDDLKLIDDVVRFSFVPLLVGAHDRDVEGYMPPTSLIEYAIDNNGVGYVFDDVPALMDLVYKYSKNKDELRLMTLWSCSSGFSYVPGEPDEYDESWGLVGVVNALEDGIKYEKL